MKKNILPFVLSTLVVLVILFTNSRVLHAEDATAAAKTRIQELQNKISELQGTENSLTKQVNLVDSQISVAQLRIESITAAIVKLGEEAQQLGDEINRLEGILTRRSELVLKRIPESYKRKQIPMVAPLFLSHNFNDFILQVKYLSSVQKEDAELLFQLKATQNNFSERKTLRETKQKQQAELQADLQQQTKELEVQKKQKQTLLDQTRSSEAVYQRLLAQALAEQKAIDQAILAGIKVGPVKKGDPIGLVGNTGYPGCSTGPHLHYEIRKNNAWINAEDYLPGKDVSDEQNGGTRNVGNGNGSWAWPIEGDIRITQRFGKTPYSWRYSYSGGIHTGIDMVGKTSEVIRAPFDGTLYSSSEACGSSSIIKIKYIEHGSGLVSFYLHVQ